ncbi:DUF1501 domain-containing protein [Calycomorphotria hydatis]|uniref:Sulfatase n=1 Tax=Calycomorphotria hydatis TaxID=2528027 RepID=A0A517T9U6_9PLAN|nr:DUF1501 domain-containing protein [Calycomorphotria hydatis]QDT65147.1 hypothetical protein V22_23940 [Calycomorphotria hydatis]
MDRRNFLQASAATAMFAATPAMQLAKANSTIKGNAEHVISIWLGGGMGAIDTFDPKRLGDPKKKVAGSYYPSIETTVPGVRVCEHLKKMAPVMDRVTAVRTVNHNVIDEHAAATNFMHTGRPVSGTVVYPSLGSIVSHEKGQVSEDAPPYVLIGYPNVTRGPGFLGAQYSYLYLTDTNRGPVGLSRPESISENRQSRRKSILAKLRQAQSHQQDNTLQDYEAAIDQSLKLSGPAFNQSFQLDEEPAELRNSYGGEFGQRCMLARRLVQRGVRFIEVSHNLNFLNGTGWDAHNQGILQQHTMIEELDTAVSTLIMDLEKQKLLEKTLIVISTEFGRPPEFDSGGGRGHQGSAFTCVLAGGGLNHCGAYGETDEIGKKITSDAVSVPDFFATIHAALGIDYSKYLYDGDRPVPVTDMGSPITKLFS